MNRDMKAVFWQSLVSRKKSLVVYCLIAIGLMWMYVAFYPSIAAQADEFNKLFESYPESFTAVLGIEEISFTSLENFLALEQFSIMWPIIAIIMLMGIAGSAVAGEIEKGTIEQVLSRPISRIDMFLGRYFAGFAAFTIFTALSVFSVFPLAALHGLQVKPDHHISVFFMCMLFGSSILSLSFLASVLFSEKSKAYFLSGGILGAMYVFSAIANLSDKIEFLKYGSFFYYADLVNVLTKNELPGFSIIIFLAFILISTAFAIAYFNKRDIAV